MALKEKYAVRLTADDRRVLERMARSARHQTRTLVHTRTLLQAGTAEGSPGRDDAAIDCGTRTVARVRRKYAEGGLEVALHRRTPTGRQYSKLDGRQEARWTLPMPADRPVELQVVDAVSDETVRRGLKRPR